MAMAISYNWLFPWGYTLYEWDSMGFSMGLYILINVVFLVLITGITWAITVVLSTQGMDGNDLNNYQQLVIIPATPQQPIHSLHLAPISSW